MFDLAIDTGNAAFVEGLREELARILREVITELEEGSALSRRLYDINGNRVGQFTLTETEDD